MLTEQTLTAKRLKKSSALRKRLKERLEKALNSSTKIELDASGNTNSSIISVLQNVGHMAKKDILKYRNQLISGLTSELVENSSHSAKEKEENIKEILEFVDETIQRITNFKLVLEGKPK